MNANRIAGEQAKIKASKKATSMQAIKNNQKGWQARKKGSKNERNQEKSKE